MNTTTAIGSNADVESSVRRAAVVGVRSTLVCCRPTCRHLKRARPENLIPFAGIEEAADAGFRLCKACFSEDVRAESGRLWRYGVRPSEVGDVFAALSEAGACGALYLFDDGGGGAGAGRLAHESPGRRLVRDDPGVARFVDAAVAHVVSGRPWDDLSLELRGTPFQLRAWSALREVPRGGTTTYGGLARRIGLSPGAARAVGSACGSNPVALLVPCHRVVRAGGGLGGYEWGLDRKKRLLDLESRPIV